ncbi:MAG TPA: DegT/DnrJ/EryC1/StrS family aminotransferase [Planctomycetota bacterium]|nr:DegT/DnrJ/EryC1/StrS family aminotransferase [Planctomycetota bacterium]
MAEKLAIEGGKPVCTLKWPAWPWFPEAAIHDAASALRTGKVNYWTGPRGMEFEAKFARWCGAKFAISTSSGTSALHVALAGLDVGPGDEVICTPYSFIASSFCVCQAGAVPVFVDVRRRDHTMDPKAIEAAITKRTRAIVPVHLYGNVCDMDGILRVARRHKLLVVEDCAQAHGATWRGRKVGTLGHANAFSFCQSKTFTTGGEGGAVTTDDEAVAWECRSFRDHGYDVQQRLRLLELEAKLPYIHNRVGFNYRLTEVQSILGLHALRQLDGWNLKRRRQFGEFLNREFAQLPEVLHVPPHNDGKRENGFWVYPLVLDIGKLRCTIREFVAALGAEGVPCGPVFWPQSYKEKAFQERRGFGRLDYPFGDPNADPKSVDYSRVHCPNAAWLEERTLVLFVLHPVYSMRHQRLVVKAVEKCLAAFRK